MLEQRSQDERRAIRRLTSERVTCTADGQRWQASLTDISSTGAFIETKQLPAIGDLVQIDFTLPFPQKGIRVHLRLHGRIVRTENDDLDPALLLAQGFSMKFSGLSPKEKDCIKNFATAQRSATYHC